MDGMAELEILTVPILSIAARNGVAPKPHEPKTFSAILAPDGKGSVEFRGVGPSDPGREPFETLTRLGKQRLFVLLPFCIRVVFSPDLWGGPLVTPRPQ
jgi:hypothetical protein